LLTTYFVTGKSLNGEASPLKSWFGLGWNSLLIFNILIFVCMSVIIFFIDSNKEITKSELYFTEKNISFITIRQTIEKYPLIQFEKWDENEVLPVVYLLLDYQENVTEFITGYDVFRKGVG
jgi:hypothetical protein